MSADDGHEARRDPLDFSGRTVLVVGGSSGIGNGTARAFRARGAEVHVWGTRPTAADYAGTEGSDLAGLHYARMDVSDFDAVAAYRAPFERLDVLVLSQGAVLYQRQEFGMAGFRRVVDVNLNSLMACCERFHPMLAASRGAIVVISSAAVARATIGNPAYNASKVGTMGLVRTLAQAWADEGIRVNALAPGLVDTNMTKVTTDDPKRLSARLKGIPMKRLGTVGEMADAVLFLASPMAGYVTGQTLIADGGRTL